MGGHQYKEKTSDKPCESSYTVLGDRRRAARVERIGLFAYGILKYSELIFSI